MLRLEMKQKPRQQYDEREEKKNHQIKIHIVYNCYSETLKTKMSNIHNKMIIRV